MVLVFVQSGLAFLALLPAVYFGICLLDVFPMDSSRIAQHCSGIYLFVDPRFGGFGLATTVEIQ